jgi:rifampicin phosphotransferase
MKFIKDTDWLQAEKAQIGGKARNLLNLKKLGYHVPAFAIIPAEVLSKIVGNSISHKPETEIIDSISFQESFIADLTSFSADTKYFAVRSSATNEDGNDFSFAGQFESFLFVKRDQIGDKIKQVWSSAYSARVGQYRKHHGLGQSGEIAVIIQEMIDASVSGVAFGLHPVTGNKSQKLINAVYGLGEGIVSGELDADSFLIENDLVTEELAEKPYQFVADYENGGTKKVPVARELQNAPALTKKHIQELKLALDHLKRELKCEQDIEFALHEERLYLLQTRPVTTAGGKSKTKGTYILWDNSNIIESYPGITTPLTFSFISKSYETAYKLFSGYLGVPEKVIRENQRVFTHTLGFINGRVYYNLKTWYHMLAMLPGYSINARFMEKMMGVKEQFDIPESYRLTKGKAWWSIVKMAVSMFFRFRSLPRKRTEFVTLLNKTIAQYKAIDYDNKNANELAGLYLTFEESLLNEWKAPLLNDFFAMIWFGLLQKQCEQFALQNPNIHNDLLCGSADIISIEPVHRSISLATKISASPDLKALFLDHEEDLIWHKLNTETSAAHSEILKEIRNYITDFGERCVGELKLETVSYTQDPSRFVRILKSYVETGIIANRFSGNIENELRSNAEKIVHQAFNGTPLKKWKFRKILSNARDLVSARENLRYERTRAFGIVREIFSQIGKRFQQTGILENPRDIFYLTKEEILAYVEGTAVSQDLKGLVAFRKTEFEKFASLDPPAERFATYGPVYHGNDFFDNTRVESPEGDLKGTGCSPGIVSGMVRVVLDPNETKSLDGDILVTTSTDPGWVMLFPGALGIIVERGSLLSHSAIVSREMGKPCIVGVTGLLKKLKTGDRIEMNGSTGTIRIQDEH